MGKTFVRVNESNKTALMAEVSGNLDKNGSNDDLINEHGQKL